MNTTEALAATVVKQEAQIKVLHQTMVELIVKVSGASFETCERNLTNAMREAHQRLLENAEDHDPALAALLDKRGPEHMPESSGLYGV
jgi:hypothetical protein